MTLLTEKPRGPYLALQNGRKVLADYHWREQRPGFPDRVQICIDTEGNGKYLTVIGEIDGPFSSWDEIHDLAIEEGGKWFSMKTE